MAGTTYIRKIDKSGRVVIPSRIRNIYNLKSNQKLIVKTVNNKIVISDHIDDLEDKIEMLLNVFNICYGNDYKIIIDKRSFISNSSLINKTMANSIKYKTIGKIITIIEYSRRESLNNEALILLKTLLSEILKNN